MILRFYWTSIAFVFLSFGLFADEDRSTVTQMLEQLDELNKSSLAEGFSFIEGQVDALESLQFADQLELLISLANQHILMGQWTKARLVLEKAQRLKGGSNASEFVAVLRARIKADIARLDLDALVSIKHYRIVRNYLSEQGDTRNEANILMIMGDIHYTSGQFESGDECFRKAANLFKSINDLSGYADALVSAGNTGMAADLEQVMGETLNALELFKQQGDLVGQGKVYQNMGYDYYSEPESAIDAFKHSIALCKETADVLTQLSAYAGLAEIYAYEGFQNEANETIDRGLHLLQSIDDPHVAAHLHRVAGVVYMFENTVESRERAHKYYEKALSFYRKQNDIELEMAVLLGLAELLYTEKRYTEALEILDPTVAWHQEYLPDLYMDVLELKRKIHMDAGDYKEALFAEMKFREYQEKEWQSGLREKYEALDKSYKEELRKSEIQLLEKENALQQLRLSQQKEKILHLEAIQAKTRMIWFIAFLLITLAFVLLATLYFLYRTRGEAVEKSNQLNQLLKKEKLDEIEKAKQLRGHNLELMDANIHLKAVHEERKELLAFAAHDLKNPLAALDSSLQLIEQGIKERESANDTLEVVELCQNSVDYMRDLISKILESKIADSHAQHIELVKLDPVPELTRMIEINRPAAEKKSIAIETDFEDAVEVISDAHALREVMDNLISNAIKYSPMKGWIRIIAEKIPEGCQIKIQDSGKGIPTEEQELLFKPFSKLSTQPTNGESSNGLGLSIARQLVESIGGSILFNNLKEGGAEFSVQLPGTKMDANSHATSVH